MSSRVIRGAIKFISISNVVLLILSCCLKKSSRNVNRNNESQTKIHLDGVVSNNMDAGADFRLCRLYSRIDAMFVTSDCS